MKCYSKPMFSFVNSIVQRSKNSFPSVKKKKKGLKSYLYDDLTCAFDWKRGLREREWFTFDGKRGFSERVLG